MRSVGTGQVVALYILNGHRNDNLHQLGTFSFDFYMFAYMYVYIIIYICQMQLKKRRKKQLA